MSWVTRVRFPERAETSPFATTTTLRAIQPTYLMGTGGTYLGAQAAG
jgi:hypothetical protein